MIHRVLQVVFGLFVLAVVFSALVPLAARLVAAGSEAAAVTFHNVLPEVLGCMVAGFGMSLFCVGLVVRVAEWLRSRDPQAARRRVVQDQRARVAVRRPAEDVPAHQDGEQDGTDPDPALEEQEEE